MLESMSFAILTDTGQKGGAGTQATTVAVYPAYCNVLCRRHLGKPLQQLRKRLRLYAHQRHHDGAPTLSVDCTSESAGGMRSRRRVCPTMLENAGAATAPP